MAIIPRIYDKQSDNNQILFALRYDYYLKNIRLCIVDKDGETRPGGRLLNIDSKGVFQLIDNINPDFGLPLQVPH